MVKLAPFGTQVLAVVQDFQLYTIFTAAQKLHSAEFYIRCLFCPAANCTLTYRRKSVTVCTPFFLNSCRQSYMCTRTDVLRYGYRPIPSEIDTEELEMLREALLSMGNDVQLLDRWYRKDSNKVRLTAPM
jgi:hypothetical protein